MSKRIGLGLCAALMLGVGLGASSGLAQDKLAVIKQRQQLMKQQSEALKTIQAYISGQQSQTAAIAKANELLELSPQIVSLFPTGTSLVEFPGQTHAKPEIWQQYDKFSDVPVVLRRSEDRLAAVVKDGKKPAVLEELDTLGRIGCGACHTLFRAPLQD